MKKCSRCHTEKSRDDFCNCSRAKDGKQPACKQCMNISYTKSRKKDQIRYQQVSRDRINRNVALMREWKEERGCRFCDETFGPCLELHHTGDDKDMHPSNAISMSFAKFLKEAEKCIVVCANCHRKIHHGVIEV